jgi:protocatechuate 3,4-dioxygenase beta subunit
MNGTGRIARRVLAGPSRPWVAALLSLVATTTVAGSAIAAPVSVTVTELSTGNPIPNATVVWMNFAAEKIYTQTNGDGVATFEPNGNYEMVVQAKGWAPIRRSIEGEAALNAAGRAIKVVMERGTPLRGSVVDEDGNPMVGATVLFSASKTYGDGRESLDTLQQTAKTGPDGRWSYDGIPADATDVSIGAFHPLALPADFTVKMEKLPDLKPLQSGTWQATLARGIPVDLAVHDPAGKPVKKAKVLVGPIRVPIDVRPVIETGDDGHVQVGLPANATTPLTVTAKGFAPELQNVEIINDGIAVAFDLKPAATLLGQVVDRTGKGVSGAKVEIESWRGFHTITILGGLTTDADGDFAWPAAPTDTLFLHIVSQGLGEATHVAATPGKPVVVTLPVPSAPAP